MSRFVRLLPPFATGRRTYSFFSSKPGGGRYFNSAKSPKAVPPGIDASASKGSVDPPSPEHSETKDESSTHSEQSASASPNDGSTPSIHYAPIPPHPMLKPHELKLHHFFALHRPLLLLNQPTSALFELQQATSASPPVLGTIDDPPEASPEADADAARQLSRALVMNRVSNAVEWENVLERLGHDVKAARGPEDARLSTSLDVMLDSTRRKKRKKMKKHKLKKRRRLLRFSKQGK